jgi:hypothetical protein
MPWVQQNSVPLAQIGGKKAYVAVAVILRCIW